MFAGLAPFLRRWTLRRDGLLGAATRRPASAWPAGRKLAMSCGSSRARPLLILTGPDWLWLFCPGFVGSLPEFRTDPPSFALVGDPLPRRLAACYLPARAATPRSMKRFVTSNPYNMIRNSASPFAPIKTPGFTRGQYGALDPANTAEPASQRLLSSLPFKRRRLCAPRKIQRPGPGSDSVAPNISTGRNRRPAADCRLQFRPISIDRRRHHERISAGRDPVCFRFLAFLRSRALQRQRVRRTTIALSS